MTLPTIGDVVDGKFRIERKLGEGGTSTVFEVRHAITDKKFAIKWLSPELSRNELAVERFVHEAKICGRYAHANAVQIYDINRTNESFYLLMELLEGESLEARLARVGRLSVEEACDIILPCTDAVGAAHRLGIVHRDLKPSNIFLCHAEGRDDDVPKVLDFGISKLSHNGYDVSPVATTARTVIGTPLYMAPEQMRGHPPDPRFDVYALGVVLYELVAGQPPYACDNFADLVFRVLEAKPVRLDAVVPVDPGFALLVARAMAGDLEDRFATMKDLARALAHYSTRRSRRASVSFAARAPAATAAAPISSAPPPNAASKPLGAETTATRARVAPKLPLPASVISEHGWQREESAREPGSARQPGSEVPGSARRQGSRDPSSGAGREPGPPRDAGPPEPSGSPRRATARDAKSASPPAPEPGWEAGARAARDPAARGSAPRQATARALASRSAPELDAARELGSAQESRPAWEDPEHEPAWAHDRSPRTRVGNGIRVTAVALALAAAFAAAWHSRETSSRASTDAPPQPPLVRPRAEEAALPEQVARPEPAITPAPVSPVPAPRPSDPGARRKLARQARLNEAREPSQTQSEPTTTRAARGGPRPRAAESAHAPLEPKPATTATLAADPKPATTAPLAADPKLDVERRDFDEPNPLAPPKAGVTRQDF